MTVMMPMIEVIEISLVSFVLELKSEVWVTRILPLEREEWNIVVEA